MRKILELSGRGVPQNGPTSICGETEHAVARATQKTNHVLVTRETAPRGTGAGAVEHGREGVISKKRLMRRFLEGYDEFGAGRVGSAWVRC